MAAHTLTLDAERCCQRDMKDLWPHMQWNPNAFGFFQQGPGQEHYRLLADLSAQLRPGSKVADVGTLYGASALALSSNPEVHVTTYDIHPCIPSVGNVLTALNRPNIRAKVMSGQLDIAYIATCDMVMLDIDPHDGEQETKFIQLLIDHGFRGILVCDDINLNPNMSSFWEEGIPATIKKIEATKLGHWTGTGIAVFDPTHLDVLAS